MERYEIHTEKYQYDLTETKPYFNQYGWKLEMSFKLQLDFPPSKFRTICQTVDGRSAGDLLQVRPCK